MAVAEPWAFAAAVLGAGLAVLSGLTVFQDARTTLRGSTQQLVFVHLALGVLLLVVFKRAFQEGFGCASCHGMKAQGGRGPGLSGGFDAARFRDTHGSGLFPSSMVTQPMVDALEAWLRTEPSGISPQGDG